MKSIFVKPGRVHIDQHLMDMSTSRTKALDIIHKTVSGIASWKDVPQSATSKFVKENGVSLKTGIYSTEIDGVEYTLVITSTRTRGLKRITSRPQLNVTLREQSGADLKKFANTSALKGLAYVVARRDA